MADANSVRPASPGGKMVLVILLAGLIGLLGTTMYYRIKHPSLIKQEPGQTAQATRDAASQGTPAAPSLPSGMAGGPGQEVTMAAMQRLQANPNDVDTLLELATLFMEQGSVESAQGFLSRALTAAPSDARPPYYQGVLFARQEKYAEAVEAMERSLRLQDAAPTRYSLAVIYIYHLKDPAKGREHLQAALKSPDVHPDLRAMIEAELAK